MPKLPLNTHELFQKSQRLTIRTGNGLVQATGPLLVATRCWGQGRGVRRARCRLGHSTCGGVSCLLAALGGCLKAISIAFCCYSYVASSKNSSLSQYSVKLCFHMYVLFQLGHSWKQNQFCLYKLYLLQNQLLALGHLVISLAVLSSCSSTAVIPSCLSELRNAFHILNKQKFVQLFCSVLLFPVSRHSFVTWGGTGLPKESSAGKNHFGLTESLHGPH